MTINPLIAEQIRRNRVRDGGWELAAGHRRHLTERLVSLAPAPAGRLCVLGAGNSNDLDLESLSQIYKEVHLVDVDGEALSRGVTRQGEPASRNVQLHAGIDLTGIWESLAEDGAAADRLSPTADGLVTRALNPVAGGLPAPFDVVVSAGMLSQLIEAVGNAVPARTPGFWDLLLAVRTGHLRLAARLTAVGGSSLIVSDFVSSATCPELDRADEAELEKLAGQLAEERNFFHGLNPVFFPTLFRSDPVLAALIADVRHTGYWLWRQRTRTYAVFALACRRSDL
ncbi:MAG TPA: hypothetical protein VHC22_00015 [Pirellulales bacterium]|nr:hypothetical protein [Pirellulales bacterium]